MLSGYFYPDRPVDDAGHLVGRHDDLYRLISVFATPSSVPILVGPPGIGKSSILNIARQGLLGLTDGFPEDMLRLVEADCMDRIVVWVRCRPAFGSPDDLAGVILEKLLELGVTEPEQTRFKTKEIEVGATLKFVEVRALWERALASEAPTTATERLRQFCSHFGRETGGEVVVMLDECERLNWVGDLLEFVREFDDTSCRFILAVRDYVGHRLTTEYRWPVAIKVKRLDKPGQTDQIFEVIGDQLRDNGIDWKVEPQVLKFVAQQSAGEPWYVQMIGWELLNDPRVDLDATTIVSDLRDAQRAERALMEGRLTTSHSDRYEQIARGSRTEEIVRAMSLFPGTTIPHAFVTKVLSKRTRSASQIVARLASGPDPVLTRADTAYKAWEFASHQFRVYCRLCEPTSIGIARTAEQMVDRWKGFA